MKRNADFVVSERPVQLQPYQSSRDLQNMFKFQKCTGLPKEGGAVAGTRLDFFITKIPLGRDDSASLRIFRRVVDNSLKNRDPAELISEPSLGRSVNARKLLVLNHFLRNYMDQVWQRGFYTNSSLSSREAAVHNMMTRMLKGVMPSIRLSAECHEIEPICDAFMQQMAEMDGKVRLGHANRPYGFWDIWSNSYSELFGNFLHTAKNLGADWQRRAPKELFSHILLNSSGLRQSLNCRAAGHIPIAAKALAYTKEVESLLADTRDFFVRQVQAIERRGNKWHSKIAAICFEGDKALLEVHRRQQQKIDDVYTDAHISIDNEIDATLSDEPFIRQLAPFYRESRALWIQEALPDIPAVLIPIIEDYLKLHDSYEHLAMPNAAILPEPLPLIESLNSL